MDPMRWPRFKSECPVRAWILYNPNPTHGSHTFQSLHGLYMSRSMYGFRMSMTYKSECWGAEGSLLSLSGSHASQSNVWIL